MDASSGHLAALWVTGLAPTLLGGNLVLSPAWTWFCPHSPVCNLALIPCGGQGWGSFVRLFYLFLTPLPIKHFLKKEYQLISSELLNREKMNSVCYTALPMHGQCTVLYNTAKHRTIQGLFASDAF